MFKLEKFSEYWKYSSEYWKYSSDHNKAVIIAALFSLWLASIFMTGGWTIVLLPVALCYIVSRILLNIGLPY